MKGERIIIWVLVLLAIVCVILLFNPVIVGPPGRILARSVLSHVNLQQIIRACWHYAEDNEGSLPEDTQVLLPYIADEDVFESPLKPKDFAGPSYIYVPGLNINLPDADKIIVIYENPGYCNELINVGFLDGSCERMKISEFQEMLKQSEELLRKQEKGTSINQGENM